MQMQVFSVIDKAVGAFLAPFMCRSKGEAIRSFTEACSDEKHQFAKHGIDYVLMYLGVFDDNTGIYTTVEPERVLSALEAVSRSERQSDQPGGQIQ